MSKILAIPGSIRGNSSTHVVLSEIAKIIPTNFSFEIYNGVGTLPHFDGTDASTPEVLNWLSKIKEADGILICTPEYAFGVPGSLKNALDWTVGSTEINHKPTALITASTGGEHGHAAMLQILSALSADVRDESKLLVSGIRSKIKNQQVVDENTKLKLSQVVNSLTAQLLEKTK